jgi:hypothetical protein
MMMQMLSAGGMPVLTDNLRTPDANNPYGYYEFERVKKLPGDAGWLDEAEGRAVKIVSMLLYHLPPARHYRIVFMTRPIDDILDSQVRMLARLGKPAHEPEQAMRQHFERHLDKVNRWLATQSSIRVLPCAYTDVLSRPRVIAQRIAFFLDMTLDIDQMVKAVDPALNSGRKDAAPAA